MQERKQILLITGDNSVEKKVFADNGFGYWSSAFDLLLEKHGLLSFEKANQSILDDPEKISNYDVLIIAWLPDKIWKRIWIEHILNFNGLVFLEGPYPRYLANRIGLKKGSFTASGGALKATSNTLRQYLISSFSEVASGKYHKRQNPFDPVSIPIRDKIVLSRPIESARQEINFDGKLPIDNRLSNILLSYLLAYRSRHISNGIFYEMHLPQVKAQLVWLMALERMNACSLKTRYAIWFIDSLLNRSKINFDKSATLLSKSIEGYVFVKASKMFNKVELTHLSDEINTEISILMSEAEKPTILIQLWLTLFKVVYHRKLNFERRETILKIVQSLHAAKTQLNSFLLWTLALSIKTIVPFDPGLSREISRGLHNYYKKNTCFDQKDNSLLLSWHQISACIQTIGCLADFDAASRSALKTVMAKIIDLAFDTEKGFFRRVVMESDKTVSGDGYQSSPDVALGLMYFVNHLQLNDLSWTLKNYTKNQIDSWYSSNISISHYIPVQCESIADIHFSSGETGTGLFKYKNILGVTFPLLSHLVHHHTVHPLSESFLDCPNIEILVLENMLFFVLFRECQHKESPLISLAPWPHGNKFCLSIRHDVDRIPEDEVFKKVLAFEKNHNLGVSWFWIPNRTKPTYMKAIASQKGENALHAMQLDKKIDEVKAVSKASEYNLEIAGENMHCGGGGDGWIGPASVLAAKSAGLSYTELVLSIYDFPYAGMPVIKEDGSVAVLSIIGLTNNLSTDIQVAKGIRVEPELINEFIHNEFYCMILNHPDINFDILSNYVKYLPEDRLNLTCKEVALWWEATHDHKNIQIDLLEMSDTQLLFKVSMHKPVNVDPELRVYTTNYIAPSATIISDQLRFQGTVKSVSKNNLKYISIPLSYRLLRKSGITVELVLEKISTTK